MGTRVGEGKPRTQKLSDGSQEDCGPVELERKEKQTYKQARHLPGALGNHTCHFPLGLCPLSGILTNICISLFQLNCKLLKNSFSFHLLHPQYVCPQQGIAHNKFTSCV